MKTKQLFTLALSLLMAISLAANVWAKPPKYKMTTQVPDNVLIPDEVDTRLGTLKFFDGVPTEETAAKVWDQLDFQRAVECMILTTPAASLSGFRRGIREFGPDNETAIIWEERLDSKALLLTGNTSVIYLFMWIDTKNGPVVLETPPNILAIVDDFWFHYVTDIGNAGPDRGKGGKYLILPPDFEGEAPKGYFVKQIEYLRKLVCYTRFPYRG
jgi:hypothetical protein